MTLLNTFGFAAAALALSIVTFENRAVAADLGGDCCADLEERIAELEATTARKGNRKVSLTVTGYVAQAITFWDDGQESNTYLWGLGPTQATNVRFTGQAQISPGWTAGYMLRLQNLDDNPFGSNQTTVSGYDGVNVQMSNWYIQSKALGRVAVGKNAQAGKSAAMFTDLSGTQIISNYVMFDGAGFILRREDGTLASPITWGNLAYCFSQSRPWGGDCNGIVANGIRYDSPVFGGFTASASWAQDDFWEIAGRYAGELAGFKVAGGIAYSENKDERNQRPLNAAATLAKKDTSYFQIGAYAQHIATGLFLHGAYGREQHEDTRLANPAALLPTDGEHWYLKGGLRRKFNGLGHTVLWGEYGNYEDQIGPAALISGVTSSELQKFGGGLAQEIDAASMTLWVKYRVQAGEVEAPAAQNLGELDDLQMLTLGGMINF